jgi:hypothetical protein
MSKLFGHGLKLSNEKLFLVWSKIFRTFPKQFGPIKEQGIGSNGLL